MEQAPDELSGREGETSDRALDDMTGEPMNAPEKQKEADGDPTPEADPDGMGG